MEVQAFEALQYVGSSDAHVHPDIARLSRDEHTMNCILSGHSELYTSHPEEVDSLLESGKLVCPELEALGSSIAVGDLWHRLTGRECLPVCLSMTDHGASPADT